MTVAAENDASESVLSESKQESRKLLNQTTSNKPTLHTEVKMCPTVLNVLHFTLIITTNPLPILKKFTQENVLSLLLQNEIIQEQAFWNILHEVFYSVDYLPEYFSWYIRLPQKLLIGCYDYLFEQWKRHSCARNLRLWNKVYTLSAPVLSSSCTPKVQFVSFARDHCEMTMTSMITVCLFCNIVTK